MDIFKSRYCYCLTKTKMKSIDCFVSSKIAFVSFYFPIAADGPQNPFSSSVAEPRVYCRTTETSFHSLSRTQKQTKSLACLTNCLNHRFPCLGEGLIKLWSVQVSGRPTFEVTAEAGVILSAGGAGIQSEQEIMRRSRVPMYNFHTASLSIQLNAGFFFPRGKKKVHGSVENPLRI